MICALLNYICIFDQTSFHLIKNYILYHYDITIAVGIPFGSILGTALFNKHVSDLGNRSSVGIWGFIPDQ